MGNLAKQLCESIRAADEAACFRLDIFSRLVYADLVERNGDTDRASAIRLHAAIEEFRPGLVLGPGNVRIWAPGPLEGWRHRICRGYGRLARLWNRHARAWRASLRLPAGMAVSFRAGLPWRVEGRPEAWPVKVRGELSVVRSWKLLAPAGDGPPSFHKGMLTGALEVSLAGPGWCGQVARLLDSGMIPSDIVSLGITDGALEADSVREILERPWPRLRRFDASANTLRAEGAAAVWSLMSKTNIRGIDLSRNNIGWGTEFLRDGGPPKLRALHFAGNHCEARGTRIMEGATCLGHLERIDWMGNSLGESGAEAVAAWRAPSLRRFSLGSNHLGPEGAGKISRARWLERLEELDLAENSLRDEGMGKLAPSLGHKLKALGLEGNLLGGDSAGFLAACASRESLVWLEIGRNGLGAEGISKLSAEAWPRLRHAGLMLNDIPPGASCPSDRFPRLAPLRLARPGRLDDRGLGSPRPDQ